MKATLKKISMTKIAVIVLLFATVLTTSCKKDNSNNPSTSGNNSLSFKLDGVTQTYTNIKGSDDGSSYIQVRSSQTSDTLANELEFYFFTDGPIMPGDSYNFGDVVYSIKYFDAGGTMYLITGGQITFTTESTSHISGRFNGTVKNGGTTKTITDGNFDIKM